MADYKNSHTIGIITPAINFLKANPYIAEPDCFYYMPKGLIFVKRDYCRFANIQHRLFTIIDNMLQYLYKETILSFKKRR